MAAHKQYREYARPAPSGYSGSGTSLSLAVTVHLRCSVLQGCAARRVGNCIAQGRLQSWGRGGQGGLGQLLDTLELCSTGWPCLASSVTAGRSAVRRSMASRSDPTHVTLAVPCFVVSS